MGLCFSLACDPEAMRLRSAPVGQLDFEAPLPPPSIIKAVIDKVIKCVVTQVMAGNRCTILFIENGLFFRQPILIDDFEPLAQSNSVLFLESLVLRPREPYPLLFAKVMSSPASLYSNFDRIGSRSSARGGTGGGRSSSDSAEDAIHHPDLHCTLFFDPRCRRSIAEEMVRAGVATTITERVFIIRRGPFAVDETYSAIFFPPRRKNSKSKGGS